jgi:hypothetical protein
MRCNLVRSLEDLHDLHLVEAAQAASASSTSVTHQVVASRCDDTADPNCETPHRPLVSGPCRHGVRRARGRRDGARAVEQRTAARSGLVCIGVEPKLLSADALHSHAGNVAAGSHDLEVSATLRAERAAVLNRVAGLERPSVRVVVVGHAGTLEQHRHELTVLSVAAHKSACRRTPAAVHAVTLADARIRVVTAGSPQVPSPMRHHGSCQLLLVQQKLAHAKPVFVQGCSENADERLPRFVVVSPIRGRTHLLHSLR